jgi:hypothetical protein
VVGLVGRNRPGAYRAAPFVRRHKPSSDKSEKGSLCRFTRGGAKLGFDLNYPQEDIKKSYQVANRRSFRRSASVEFKIEELITSRD